MNKLRGHGINQVAKDRCLIHFPSSFQKLTRLRLAQNKFNAPHPRLDSQAHIPELAKGVNVRETTAQWQDLDIRVIAITKHKPPSER